MRYRFPKVFLILALLGGWCSAVVAQEPAPDTKTDRTAPPPNCQVDTQQQRGSGANADSNQSTSTKPPEETNQANAQQLQKCRGMLKPPPVGDSDIVEPTPNTGKTPVIHPDAKPEQQSK
jgi:hypothetical protein